MNNHLETTVHQPSSRLRRRLAAVALSLVAIGVLGPTPADAAEVIYRAGTTGYVRFSSPEGSCNFDGYNRVVNVTVYGPQISGARLSNGSNGQWAIARAVTTDVATGQVVYGNWSGWKWTTATAYTRFPDLKVSAPWNFEREYVTVEIYWHDPVSRVDSGYAEIALTRLFHVGRRAYDTTQYVTC
jgi:hypothetical protein